MVMQGALMLEEEQLPGTEPSGFFKFMCTFTAVLACGLFLTLSLMPALIYWLFSVTPHETADFLARRAAMLFGAFGVLSFLAASARSHEARFIVGLSIALAMFGLGLLGLYELARGFAGPGILLAIGIELAICIGFLWALRDV